MMDGSIVQFEWPSNSRISALVAAQAAAGILLVKHAHSDRVSFETQPVLSGSISVDRGVQKNQEIHSMSVELNDELELGTLVDRLEQGNSSLSRNGQISLQRVLAPISSAIVSAVNLTLLVHHSPTTSSRLVDDIWKSLRDAKESLVIECATHTDQPLIRIRTVGERHAKDISYRMLDAFDLLLQEITTMPGSTRIRDLWQITDEDRRDIWKWNKSPTPTVDTCAHDLIKHQVQISPDAPAIYSWDGECTYAELDRLSGRLAHHLITQWNIGSEKFVPLCFEKSMWTVVALLAVLKAGGAFVLLDPEHPRRRLEHIVRQLNADILLTTPKYAEKCTGIATRFVVGSKEMDGLDHDLTTDGYTVPSHAAYAIFTSGSTGTPKGVVIEHRQLSTSAVNVGKTAGFDDRARILQFSAYTFDPCVMEMIGTLVHGGCICIPSDWQRMNSLTDFMNEASVTCAFLTPSIVKRVPLNTVQSLHTLCMGGEKVEADIAHEWENKVRLLIVYGPAECTIICSILDTSQYSADDGSIGYAVGARSWIVDASDVDRLCPIGAVGELIVEGPMVGRGYINDEKKTNEAFIKNPSWMPMPARVYKTGDLVRYNQDGSIRFLDRKDTQVKLRGQRIEQGEVEQQIRRCLLPHHVDVAVEVISPEAIGGTHILAAFVTANPSNAPVGEDGRQHRPGAPPRSKSSRNVKTGPPAAGFVQRPDFARASTYSPEVDNASRPFLRRRLTAASGNELSYQSTGANSGTLKASRDLIMQLLSSLKEKLSLVLPSYMVPCSIVFLPDVPLNPSGKVDRRMLREMANKMSTHELQVSPIVEDTTREMTAMEAQVQRLWAQNLGIPTDRIGCHSNFFQHGGDSLLAMRLVTAARQAGLSTSVEEILRYPDLSEFSAQVKLLPSDSLIVANPVDPLSLLRSNEHELLVAEAIQQCQVDKSAIEDIYPCTALQESLVALSVTKPTTYVLRHSWLLPQTVRVEHFKAAWEKTRTDLPILRTRFIQPRSSSLMQVVIKDNIDWSINRDCSFRMEFGAPMVRYYLAEDPLDEQLVFMLELHHSVIDGWSLPHILNCVEHNYQGKANNSAPNFNCFIKYMSTLDQASSEAYWLDTLANAVPQPFPSLPVAYDEPQTDSSLRHTIAIPKAGVSSITIANIIRAAWSLLVARYSGADDIVYGVTQSGRNVPMPGIEDIVGPTLTTVPLRVRIESNEQINDFLDRMQVQSLEMMPYEHLGLSKILQLSADSRLCCSFQNLLVIQPLEIAQGDRTAMLFQHQDENILESLNYALVMECFLGDHEIMLQARFDSNVLHSAQVDRLLHQLEYVLQQLSDRSASARIKDIAFASPSDISQISSWNSSIPEAWDVRMPDLIRLQEERQPSALAVNAWDGDLTYSRLYSLSVRLANHLRSLGVRLETYVPICFEKSLWAVVAMLGVMIAGGACVTLDPSHPHDRRQSILANAKAQLVICSPTQAALFEKSPLRIVSIGPKTVSSLPLATEISTEMFSPNDAAFIIFTSGSTGVPKGIIIEHEAFCTSVIEHGALMKLDSHSRVFQFSAFTFDVSFSDIFATLAHGGCVCIPSDHDRMNDLEGAMRRFNVNVATLTRTVVSQIQPERVENLKGLFMIGEAPSKDTLAVWADRVLLGNMYGPAECTIYSSAKVGFRSNGDPFNIGTGMGARLWITEVDDHSRLAPVGAVGEILIEGPVLGRCYLNEPARTAEAFVAGQGWAQAEEGEPSRRLYKTGDLGRYDVDGSIIYLGRRDTQIKVGGQRVELGEVEHQIRRLLPESVDVVVEAATLHDVEADVKIVCFVVVGIDAESPDSSDILLTSSAAIERLGEIVCGFEDQLRNALPRYMIPRLYLPVSHIPVSGSAKTDRKTLRQLASQLTTKDLSNFFRDTEVHSGPLTDAERSLSLLWKDVLHVDLDRIISAADDWFHLGGDSVAAMRLVKAARESGFALSVKQIFRHTTLSHMAKEMSFECDRPSIEVAPYALIQPPSSLEDCLGQAVEQCRVPADRIEDLYPCTPTQVSEIDFSSHWPPRVEDKGGPTAQVVFSLSKGLDLERFRCAWNMVAAANSILRTRIVHSRSGFLQVVLKDGPKWQESDCLETYLAHDKADIIRLGDPLYRLCIVPSSNTGSGYFVFTAHHAFYDGESLSMIYSDVRQCYEQQVLGSRPLTFKHFVKHILDVDQSMSDAFWRSHLAGSRARPLYFWPQSSQPRAASASTHQFNVPTIPKRSATIASIIQVAWSVMHCLYTNSDEAVIISVRTGRDAGLPGVENTMGPTFTSIPVRIPLLRHRNVHEVLQSTQRLRVDMLPYESAGVHHVSGLSADARTACNAGTVMVINPTAARHTQSLPGCELDRANKTYPDPLPLNLQFYTSPESLEVVMTYDDRLFYHSGVRTLLVRFEQVFCRLLMAGPDTTMEDVLPSDIMAEELYRRETD